MSWIRMEIVSLDWCSVKSSIKLLADKVVAERPEVVVAVGSGGLVVAGVISRLIGVRDVRVMSVRKYSDDKPPRQVEASPIIEHDNTGDIVGKRVLLVDDFSSTGETLERARGYLYEKGASGVVTCSLVAKETGRRPDHYALAVSGCVVFPWE